MYKISNKIVSLLLALCMIFSVTPAVYAESTGDVMTQVDFTLYGVYGVDASIMAGGAGYIDHLSYFVDDNEPVDVYDGSINQQFDAPVNMTVTVFVGFGADVTDGSAHNVTLQYYLLDADGIWSEQMFDEKTVYCPEHGVPAAPEPTEEPEPTETPAPTEEPNPTETPAPSNPPEGGNDDDGSSVVNPGDNDPSNPTDPGNPSIVIGDPSNEDPYNPYNPGNGDSDDDVIGHVPGFWVYSPPNSEEIDMFYVSPDVRELVNIDATLADIARKELDAEDNHEERYKTDVVKYNNWFYDVEDADSVSDYDGELSEHNWNATFVTWCAHRLSYIDFNRFPMTNDASEMLRWLSEVEENNMITLSESLSTLSDQNVQEGDIVFIPDEAGYTVGIVSEFNKEERTAVVIFGDHNKAVEEETLDLLSLPSTTSFVHIYVPDAQVAAMASFLIRELEIKPSAAAGILANVRWESGFNPTALGDGGTSYGLCQWHLGRWDDLVEYCNSQDVSWTTVEGQLMFLVHELKTKYPGLIERMQTCKDDDEGAYDIAFDFSMTFERPAGMEASASMRGYSASRTMFPTLVRAVEDDSEDADDDATADVVGEEIVAQKASEIATETHEDAAEYQAEEDAPAEENESDVSFPWRRIGG